MSAAALGPCDCEWCKRYGNQDAAPTDRPVIRNGSMLIDIAGRCTRCHYPLDRTAHLVREKLVACVRYFGDKPIAFHSFKHVPVCDVCVLDRELNQARYKTGCLGCGRLVSFPRRMARGREWADCPQTCSNACYRKALRKQRRPKTHECITCKAKFKSSRADAQFCSSACRQWAYRLRAKAPLAEQVAP
jgi:hypothetical protein